MGLHHSFPFFLKKNLTSDSSKDLTEVSYVLGSGDSEEEEEEEETKETSKKDRYAFIFCSF